MRKKKIQSRRKEQGNDLENEEGTHEEFIAINDFVPIRKRYAMMRGKNQFIQHWYTFLRTQQPRLNCMTKGRWRQWCNKSRIIHLPRFIFPRDFHMGIWGISPPIVRNFKCFFWLRWPFELFKFLWTLSRPNMQAVCEHATWQCLENQWAVSV